MIDFTIKTRDLKKGLTLADLSVASAEDVEESHCLFNVLNGAILEITALDKVVRLAKAVIDINTQGDTGFFTADPAIILNLLKKSEADIIRIVYNSETKSVEIYSSEDAASYIALPSFDVTAPMPDVFEKAYEMKTVDAGILQRGLRFASGFVNAKDSKFENIYISKGILYGSNGSNQVGAFTTAEFNGLDELTLPGAVIPDILNLITKVDLQEVSIRTTSNIIILCSADSRFNFGFTKVQMNMPRMPIAVTEPDQSGWAINKSTLLKKLSRLHLSGGEKLGVRAVFSNDTLGMTTAVKERPSKETMTCKKIRGEDKEIIFDCRIVESAVELFNSTFPDLPDIKMFIDKHMTFFSSGDFEIEDNGQTVVRPFTSVALIGRARE